MACDGEPEAGTRGPHGSLRLQKRVLLADGVERDAQGIPLAAPVSAAARDRVGRFLEMMVRPPLDETSDLHDTWFHETQKELKSLMESGDEDLGHAALHAFCGEVSEFSVTRRALLMIGASCAPEAATPLLEELMLTYGYRYDDRTEAALLLAQADPERFLADVATHLRRGSRPTKTWPPDEFLLKGWVEACRRLEQSPVEMCADVAVNLVLEPSARYLAVEVLGRFPDDPLGRAALETCLIESSGDGYVRRKSAQAISVSFSREDACSLLTDVLSKETDSNFAAFLRDTLTFLGCR